MTVNDDELEQRLRSLGTDPIDPATRAGHMRRIADAATTGEPRRRGFVWGGIAAAAIVGFLAGSTGLAMADALPNPAQDVAHDVLHVVNVQVPAGKEGKRGPCMASAAKIKDKDAKQAAKDACPKGGNGGGDEGNGGGGGNGAPASDDPCHGRPPWAGPMSKADRQAAKESASRAQCPADDEDQESAEPGDGAPGGPPAPDDPCRGRPPWAGPMSKEAREAAKAAASRDACPDDDEDDDSDEEAEISTSQDATPAGATTTTTSPSASTTTSTTTTTTPEVEESDDSADASTSSTD
jgi:hypothetical protein